MREIVFFSTMNGVADAFPIVPAKNVSFNWVEKSRNDYKKELEQNKGTRFPHLYRCPGIFEIASLGYIMPMPWDVSIQTKGDGKHFSWSFPSEDLQTMFQPPLLTGHFADQTAKFLPIKPNSLESIIKLNTPWHCIVPDGVKFLMLPIPYPDSYDFENVSGVLDTSISSEINFQLRWNILNGMRTIKAGTPMAQLIPLTTEKFKLTVRNATDHDLEWIKKRNYFNNCSMAINRPMIQKMYRQFFEKKSKLFDILHFLRR